MKKNRTCELALKNEERLAASSKGASGNTWWLLAGNLCESTNYFAPNLGKLVKGSFRMKSTSYAMKNVKRVHDSIKPSVWSPASSPSLSESSLARWVAVSGSARAQLSTVRARYARPHSPPAKLDSDKFGKTAADQTCWLDWVMKCDGDHHHHSSLWYFCV